MAFKLTTFAYRSLPPWRSRL